MDIRAIFMGIAFSFFWSSAFTSARLIVIDAPPITALAVRFLISGTVAVAIAAYLGQSARLTKQQWGATVVFGLCQNGLYLGLNFVAMQTVQASLATIIASTLPLLVAVASGLFLNERLSRGAILGLVLGFAGAAIIMGARLSIGVDLFGVALCVLGVIALTTATMLVTGASSGGNFLMIVGIQMLIGAAPLAVIGALSEVPAFNPTLTLALSFTYTLIFPGLIATVVWFHLVNRIGPTRAATFHFLNPFFGVAVAALILGEQMTLIDGLGVLIIMAGIYLVQRSRSADNRVKT